MELDDATTVSSIGLESAAFNSRPSSQGRNSQVSTIAKDAMMKMERVKAELQAKKARLLELKSELKRVEIAIERRQKKAAGKWDQQLQSAQQEHEKTLQEAQSFYETLHNDVKKLSRQRAELEAKQLRLGRDQQENLIQAKADAEKRLERARKQWQKEERALLDKASSQRLEAMQKAAADSFTPILDDIVRSNKEKLEAARVSAEQQLRRLQQSLEGDKAQIALNKLRQTLNDQLAKETESAQQLANRRLDEAKRRLHAEEASIRTAHDAAMNRLKQEMERGFTTERDSHTIAMTNLRDQQARLVQELMIRQQEEVAELMRRQGSELTRAAEQAGSARQQLEERAEKLKQSRQAELYRTRVQQLRRELAIEAETIQRRLTEESRRQRDTAQREHDQRLLQQRAGSAQSLQILRENEQRALQRQRELRVEVETLTRSLESVRQGSLPSLRQELASQVRPALVQVRQELRELEEQHTGRERALQAERQTTATQLEETVSKMRNEVTACKQQLQEIGESQTEQIQQRSEEVTVELNRIKGRVEQVLSRKNQALQDLERQCEELREENANKRQRIESLRHAAYA